MNELVVRRRKFAVQAAVILLTIVTERILRFPCCLMDHKHCFSLDRFDPTCPQCM
jgi:hypothetical protein